MEPFKSTKNLLSFLDLPSHKFVEDFVDINFSNSKDTTFNWRTTLEEKHIIKIQNVCKEPMKMLGYSQMMNISIDRNNHEFPMIVKQSKDVWPDELS